MFSSSISPKRLASLLIVTQLVNQVTEAVIPFLVDRFISAPHRTESKDDPQEDKFRNQSTLPAFPVCIQYYEFIDTAGQNKVKQMPFGRV